ncbi:hypothetical protein B0H13DRAFT_2317503 [Mycena leptocephala]|nr:hypothetical protein B0H13DRAFT_2317503 [Mycena leptocephala]
MTPSTDSSVGDIFNDGYGINLLMADTREYFLILPPSSVLTRATDESSSSGFSSALPSSIPGDDGRSSQCVFDISWVVIKQFTSGLGGDCQVPMLTEAKIGL